MKNNKLYINTISSNKLCKKCNSLLSIRNYKKFPVRLSRKHYYFSEWDYCPECGATFFEEKNKVFLTDENRKDIFNTFNKNNKDETKSLF